MSETIFATATAPGKAGVSVIRISGPAALEVIRKFIRGDKFNKINSHSVYYTSFYSPSDNTDIIDKGFFIYFQSPNSFTGEDVVEFHLHGSPAVIKSMLEQLGTLGLCRIAKPGEFSMQAFYNGKFDLIQGEGLGLLIDAETEKQRKLAWGLLSGHNSLLLEKLREEILLTLSLLEVLIDFPDEDIPPTVLSDAEVRIDELKKRIKNLLSTSSAAKRIVEGIKVVITGEPNVGKSTLINAISNKPISIVTDIPGTTRDVVETRLDINGVPVIFKDTAGIRNASDVIEKEGIQRAQKAISDADIIIKIVDIRSYINNPTATIELDERNENIPMILIANKIDLLNQHELLQLKTSDNLVTAAIKSGINLEEINRRIELLVANISSLATDSAIVNERQYSCLNHALEELSNFNINLPLDISCEYLRRAATSLDMLIGSIEPEEILDSVFGNFCIGK